ncbi:hypothetical protein [Streptomyces sp. NBC_01477]|uniref:hypothetical protein n=1 Tax=Streptomyces sp. NBC_01477 TaxID=2976015 RepID=UPI002E345E54|nr:hypothetical protein [Streptomyces sp. NBC_01477]
MTHMHPAPWWHYAVTIGALNIARQFVFPPEQVGTAATISLFFAVVAIGFLLVTALRALTAPRGRE